MSFTIGASVQTIDGKIHGYVIDIRGAAGGPTYVIRQRGNRAISFKGEELQAGPPVPSFERGFQIHLHGSIGTVIGRDGPKYIVETQKKLRGFRYPSRYHLNGWEVALCEPATADCSAVEKQAGAA